jgi:hypothetical protein
VKRVLIIAAGTFLGILAIILLLSGGLFGGRGGWTIDRTADPMSDEVSAEAKLRSNEDNGQLVLSCKDGGALSVLIVSDGRTGGLGDDENYVGRPLNYRFDKDPPEAVTATLGDSFVGFTSKDRAVERRILDRLLKASSFAAQFDPVRGDRVSMTFDVADAADAAAKVREQCHR